MTSRAAALTRAPELLRARRRAAALRRQPSHALVAPFLLYFSSPFSSFLPHLLSPVQPLPSPAPPWELELELATAAAATAFPGPYPAVLHRPRASPELLRPPSALPGMNRPPPDLHGQPQPELGHPCNFLSP